MSSSNLHIRFAVGNPSGPRSGVWRAWSNKGDVYVAARSTAGLIKLSLHANGWCGLAITAQHYSRMVEMGGDQFDGRTLLSWNRADSPEKGVKQALVLEYPTEFMRKSDDRPSKEITWVPAAPHGMARRVEFFYTRQFNDGYGSDSADVEVICHAHLPNETVIVVHRALAFDGDGLRNQLEGNTANGRFLTGQRDLSRGDLRMVLYGDPPKIGAFRLIEVAIAAGPAAAGSG